MWVGDGTRVGVWSRVGTRWERLRSFLAWVGGVSGQDRVMRQKGNQPLLCAGPSYLDNHSSPLMKEVLALFY